MRDNGNGGGGAGDGCVSGRRGGGYSFTVRAYNLYNLLLLVAYKRAGATAHECKPIGEK